ncbi:hypothetical protein MLD38_015728 [Melastoma candidum]|uniref:Uncharacterized protein n=1 Tax=Melastoma candidum TaxID=119954 RepID=A0ACB9RI98_9MYRT|nr:hypothetical protein MLD38_015728 [Melastoma candidum]
MNQTEQETESRYLREEEEEEEEEAPGVVNVGLGENVGCPLICVSSAESVVEKVEHKIRQFWTRCADMSLSCTFTITNNCPVTIWPGTLAGAGTPQLPTTGFALESGRSIRIPSVPGWSGRIWARTGCTFDETGTGTCLTGDCGGRLECDGNGAMPPASLFEITLGKGAEDKDFYDVSMVDGYNLPLIAVPQGAYGECNVTGCTLDINVGCPKELQVIGGDGSDESGGVIACKSACEAFGLDQYCCSGEFANPTTCRPSFYSDIFKRACPSAYSYAFDDGTSTFTCKSFDYGIVFCPDIDGVKGPDGAPTSLQITSHGRAVQMVSSVGRISSFSGPILIFVIASVYYLNRRDQMVFQLD